MFNKRELKYIQKFLWEREEQLQESNDEIERRSCMDSKYKKLTTKLLGSKFFKTKTWEKKVEVEFNILIKVQDKISAALEE